MKKKVIEKNNEFTVESWFTEEGTKKLIKALRKTKGMVHFVIVGKWVNATYYVNGAEIFKG